MSIKNQLLKLLGDHDAFVQYQYNILLPYPHADTPIWKYTYKYMWLFLCCTDQTYLVAFVEKVIGTELHSLLNKLGKILLGLLSTLT